METGNLSEWKRGTDTRPDHDSGRCYRPPEGVSSRHAHNGKYSMKLTINTESGKAGCRQNRDVEARTGDTFVYSAWYYLPRREVPTQRHVECLSVQVGLAYRCLDRNGSFLDDQHRAKPTRSTSTRVEVERRTHGSHARRIRSFRRFADTGANVPSAAAGLSQFGGGSRSARKLKQSGAFGGRLVVRQNGVLLWDMRHVRTKYPDGRQSWSVANYSNGIRDNPGDDLHRRRESRAALTGLHVPLCNANGRPKGLLVRREGPAGSTSRCCRR